MGLSRLLLLGVVILLSACVSRPYSNAIRQAPEYNLQLSEILGSEGIHRDSVVRWGGTIASVDQFADGWQLTVLERKLASSGRPLRDSLSDGRFAIFIPATEDLYYHFEVDREITVLGTVDGVLQSYIGKQEYTYPVVKAIEYRLWRDYYQYHMADYYPHDYYHHYRHGFFWHNHYLCLNEYYWFNYHHHNRSSSLWSSSYRLRNALDKAGDSLENQRSTTATLPRHVSKEEEERLRRTRDAEKFKDQLRNKNNYDDPSDRSSDTRGSVTIPQTNVSPSRSPTVRKTISVDSSPSLHDKKVVNKNTNSSNEVINNKKHSRTNRRQISTTQVHRDMSNNKSKKYKSFKPKVNSRTVNRTIYRSSNKTTATPKSSSSSNNRSSSSYSPPKSSSNKSSSRSSSSSNSTKRSRGKINRK